MTKTLTGGALISYGTLLPSASNTPDGSLFYKTMNTGTSLGVPTAADGPQGLYVLSFVSDSDSAIGRQVAQTWRAASATDVDAALLGGQPPSYYQPADPDLTALSAISGTGIYVVTGSGTSVVRELVEGTGIAITNKTGVAGNITISVPTSLSINHFTGPLNVSKGGTGLTVTTPGGVVYGTNLPTLATTLAGTAGQVLTSTGTGAPVWGDTVAYANSAGVASQLVMSASGFSNYSVVQHTDGSVKFRYGVSDRMTLDISGNLTAVGDVTAFSDLRLKRNVKQIEGALDKVEALIGVTFTRKADQSRSTGLIAQDVKAVMPEAVQTHDDGMLSVAYGNLVGLLVEAIKELRAEVKEIKSKLT